MLFALFHLLLPSMHCLSDILEILLILQHFFYYLLFSLNGNLVCGLSSSVLCSQNNTFPFSLNSSELQRTSSLPLSLPSSVILLAFSLSLAGSPLNPLVLVLLIQIHNRLSNLCQETSNHFFSTT
jgi:hypothetical protein